MATAQRDFDDMDAGHEEDFENNDENQINWGGAVREPRFREDVDTVAPYKMDIAQSRYPYAITWTPLPLISWFLPFIGHMGIADSRGVIYDFAGPYSIGIDDMAFGKPTRYLTLNPSKVGIKDKAPSAVWDTACDKGCQIYSNRMHNICCDNCHSHVARCLNEMRYMGRTDWNMVKLCFWILWSGKWVSWKAALATWLPFLLIVIAIILLRSLL